MADIEQLSEHITDLNQKIKLLDEAELPHLYELHELYYRLFTVMGDLVAEALFMRDEAYMERKSVYAEVMSSEQGTIADKEAKAELQSRVIGIKKTKRINCIPNIKVSSGPSIINSTTSKQSERIWSENYKIHLNNGAESPLFFLEINNFYRKDNFR